MEISKLRKEMNELNKTRQENTFVGIDGKIESSAAKKTKVDISDIIEDMEDFEFCFVVEE